LHTQVVVNNARNNIITHPQRDLNYRFMIAEWLWIQSGREDLAWIAQFNKQITQFSDDGKTFRGAYGPRFRKQIGNVVELLKRDPDSRQAVVAIFNDTDLVGTTRDVPCTLSLQLFIRNDSNKFPRVHGVMTMRSNDLWLGFPYDFFNFSQITNSIAGELGITVGSFTLQAGSSHVYATDYDKVREVLEPLSGKIESAWEHSPVLERLLPSTVCELLEGDDPIEIGACCRELTIQETAYVAALKCKTKAAALGVLKTL
jgi:thymidylate synthase